MISDVERLPEGTDDQELVARAAGARPLPDRVNALKELLRRSSPRAAPLVRSIVQDRAAPADLRITAAIALGEAVGPDHQRALIGALGTEDPRVLRRVVAGLGRIGGPDVLPALRAVRRPQDQAAARALDFARSLIAYRHGLATDLLRPPSNGTVPLTEGRARELKPEPLTVETARRIAARQTRELPGIAVSAEGGVGYTCGENALALLPNRAPAGAAKGSFVPAVLMKQSHSLGYFSAHLYILSHPVGSNRLAVFGVRPDGTVTHSGAATMDGRQFAFHIEALDTPLSPPVTFEGRLHVEPLRMELTRILVGLDKAPNQQRARVPQRAPIVAKR